jgi:hypothetical protein
MGLLSLLGGVAGSFFGAPAIGAAIGGAIEGSQASSSASQAQQGAAQAGIDEQRRQFAEIQKLLAPYVQAGQGAIGGFQPFQQAGAQAFEQQRALAGLGGTAAQQAAINQIEQNPLFQSQIRQGEEALLQRASATGGLRGGNIQAALAQFRPQMLQQAIEQQYGRLGGIAGTGLGVTEQLYRGGQASAAGQASQAGTLGSNVANLLAQQGAAQAGGIMGQQQAFGGVPAAFGFGQTSGMNPFSNGLSGLQAGFSGTSLGSSGFGSGMAYGNADLGSFL